jgi:hypothetical protein
MEFRLILGNFIKVQRIAENGITRNLVEAGHRSGSDKSICLPANRESNAASSGKCP